jgi:hypothetical protein
MNQKQLIKASVMKCFGIPTGSFTLASILSLS